MTLVREKNISFQVILIKKIYEKKKKKQENQLKNNNMHNTSKKIIVIRADYNNVFYIMYTNNYMMFHSFI